MNREQNTAVEYYPTNQETIPDNVTKVNVFTENVKNIVKTLCGRNNNEEKKFVMPEMLPQDKEWYGKLNNIYLKFSLELIESEYVNITNNESIYGKERRQKLALLRIAYHEKIKNTSEKR